MPGTKEGSRKSPWIKFCRENREYKRRNEVFLHRLTLELVEAGIDASPVLRIVTQLLSES